MDKYPQERKVMIDMLSKELERLHKAGYSFESSSIELCLSCPEEDNPNPKDLVKIELVFKDTSCQT